MDKEIYPRCSGYFQDEEDKSLTESAQFQTDNDIQKNLSNVHSKINLDAFIFVLNELKTI